MMAKTQLIPNFTEYLSSLADCAVKLDKLGVKNTTTHSSVKEYSSLLDQFTKAVQVLDSELLVAKNILDEVEKSEAYRDKIVPAMEKAREVADKLETMTSKEGYKIPTYSDIMFYN